ncbi:MAG: hypothetical protein MdMp014T_2927 [Treponematales bacterium]
MVSGKRRSVYCDEYCARLSRDKARLEVNWLDDVEASICERCRMARNSGLRESWRAQCKENMAKHGDDAVVTLLLRGQKNKTKYLLGVAGTCEEEFRRGEQVVTFPAKELLAALGKMPAREKLYYEEDE